MTLIIIFYTLTITCDWIADVTCYSNADWMVIDKIKQVYELWKWDMRTLTQKQVKENISKIFEFVKKGEDVLIKKDHNQECII